MRVHPRALVVFVAFQAAVWLAVDGRFALAAAAAALVIELALWSGLVLGSTDSTRAR